VTQPQFIESFDDSLSVASKSIILSEALPFQTILERHIWESDVNLNDEINENVDETVLAVSSSILRSTSRFCAGVTEYSMSVELRSNAMARLRESLSDLDVTESARAKLLRHAEQMAVVKAVWKYYSTVASESDPAPQSVMIKDILEDICLKKSNFFKSPDVPSVLKALEDSLNTLPPCQSLEEAQRLVVFRISSLVSLCFSSALSYRRDYSQEYHISASSNYSDWLGNFFL
jgi:hypothetical protein